MDVETVNKAQKFGEYLMSLTPTEKAFCGQRVKVITPIIIEI